MDKGKRLCFLVGTKKEESRPVEISNSDPEDIRKLIGGQHEEFRHFINTDSSEQKIKGLVFYVIKEDDEEDPPFNHFADSLIENLGYPLRYAILGPVVILKIDPNTKNEVTLTQEDVAVLSSNLQRKQSTKCSLI